MLGSIVSFLVGEVTTNHALVALAATWLWHHVSSSTRAKIEGKVREACANAFKLANVAGLSPDVIEAAALARVKATLTSLKIPLSDEILGLVQHELDGAKAQLAAQQAATTAKMSELAGMTAHVADLFQMFNGAQAKAKADFADVIERVPELAPDAPLTTPLTVSSP